MMVAGSDEHTHSSTEISRSVMRIQVGALALVCAVIGGTVVFLATIWLVLKGGPNVGSHLQLLGQYFIGYSVTWTGSVIGLLYGAFTGALAGWAIGTIYNGIVRFRGG